MELDRLIKVRRDAPLPESGSKAEGEIVERRRSIRMTGGTSLQGRSTPYTRTFRNAGRMKPKSASGQRRQ
ncbi:hypothetical protein BDR05DRAFT_963395, partial [Suillus weaverae]